MYSTSSASVALATRGLRGESPSRDRSRSWTVATSRRPPDGLALRARLGAMRTSSWLVAVGDAHRVGPRTALGAAMGRIAHAAYHLGAVRQRLSARPSQNDGVCQYLLVFQR